MSQRLALLATLVLVALAFGPGAQPAVTARTAAHLAQTTASALPAPSPSLASPSTGAAGTTAPTVSSRTLAPKGTAPATAGAAAQPRSLQVSNGSWTTYHNNDGHTGYDASLNPLKSFHNVATGWTTGPLDGQVYAEPLVWGGLVFAVTLNNTVYAFNQLDGSQVIWQRNLGAPNATGWACGNVSPQGILGTPVIDPVAQVIYVAAFFSDHSYHVMGLNANSGVVLLDTTLVPPVTGPFADFDWTIQQERGALALHNGYVYVPFGGRAGDCANPNTLQPYHGYVVGVPTAGGVNPLKFYEALGAGVGIWAAGGVAVDDATGNVFVATGNGIQNGCSADGNGDPLQRDDAVVRLSPTLSELDWFTPQDWQAHWCQNDQDLGSAGPLLISPNLLFQSGKWGTGFLIDPNNLGHRDGQLFPSPSPAPYTEVDVCFGSVNDATFGSFAYAPPFIYLECDGHGLVALNTNAGAPSFSPCDPACAGPNWHSGGTLTFGPPIVAGGAVWVVDINGSGLYAFDQTTGAQLYHSAGFGVHHFVTPSEAGGHVYVPSGNVIRSFNLQFGTLPSSPNPKPSRGPVLPAPVISPTPTRTPVSSASPPPPPTDR